MVSKNASKRGINGLGLTTDKILRILTQRPCGVMDSASDFGSEGCGFKSHRGRSFYASKFFVFAFGNFFYSPFTLIVQETNKIISVNRLKLTTEDLLKIIKQRSKKTNIKVHLRYS